MLNQPMGAVSTEANRQSIARIYSAKKSEVAYLKEKTQLNGLKHVYINDTQQTFKVSGLSGEVLSWSIENDILTIRTSTGSFPCFLSSYHKAQKLSFEDFGASSNSNVDQSQFINKAAVYSRASGINIWSAGKYYITGNVDFSGVEAGGFSLIGPSGSTSQQIIANGDTKLYWFSLDKVYLRHSNGNLSISDFNFSNTRSTAALLSAGLTASGSLSAERGTFKGCYYGILRQGDPDSSSPLRSVRLSGLQFIDMQADCIELNLGINDGYTIIEDVVIDGVNHTGSNPFWGIGIGIAGKGGYALTDDPSQMYKNLTIRNCRIYNSRQCIHLEKVYDPHIDNIEMYPNSAVSVNTGLDVGGLVIYGGMGGSITNITGSPMTEDAPMIWQAWGVVSGAYFSAGRNLSISDVNVKGKIQIEMSATNDFLASLKMDRVTAGSIYVYGHISNLWMHNIESAVLEIDTHRVLGNGKDNIRRTNKCLASIKCLKSFDKNMNPSGVTLGNLSFDQMEVEDNNFTIEKTTNSSTILRGSNLTKIDGTFYYNGTGFPIGYQFKKGERVVDSTGTIFTLTSDGALLKLADATTAIAALAVDATRVFANGSENWISTYPKTAGLRITIPGAGAGGADLVTRVKRSGFVSAGSYCFDIEDKVVTPVSAGTIISPTVKCTYTTK